MTAEEILNETLTQEQAPVEQEVAQAPVEKEVVEQVPQVPQFDPSMFEAMAQSQYGLQERIGGLESTLNSIRESQENANKPEPTEEELITAQLAERFGINQLKEQLSSKDGELQQMKEMMQQIQQEREIASRQNAVDDLAKRYDNFDEKLIINELEKLNQVNPQMAQALNNPQGWEMLWKSNYQELATKQPDPITPSETSGGDFSRDSAQKFQSGTASSDDIADLLFSYSK